MFLIKRKNNEWIPFYKSLYIFNLETFCQTGLSLFVLLNDRFIYDYKSGL